jgi:hypothetical protein
VDQGVSIINSTINLAAKTAVNEDENLIIFWGVGNDIIGCYIGCVHDMAEWKISYTCQTMEESST